MTNRYRITFKSGNTSGIGYYDAESAADALAAAALEHDPFELVDIRPEQRGPGLTLEQQRDGLVKAMTPIFTVLRALLDNPTTSPLFVEPRRSQLEKMLAEAQEAMLNAVRK
jgi:hypothetical protein